ncbi:hypothetical protein [Scytonema sp. PRP1]|uniref:hypothetical protein n=1 Tax=Scytonema sp. PRP1 TaxID=3120513 RepID=UPI002FD460F9
MNTSNQQPNQSIFSENTAKTIFTSRTFWGAILSAVAALVPLGVDSLKAHKITIEDAGQAVLILCGVGTAIIGRVEAKDRVYTPSFLPGPNKSDFETQVSPTK